MPKKKDGFEWDPGLDSDQVEEILWGFRKMKTLSKRAVKALSADPATKKKWQKLIDELNVFTK